MTKISIVIPVYNAEKFIEKCVSSILEQTYNNFEIILVDDGSTDNSLNICNNFEKKDKRIKVIHQENQGPGVARLNGFKNTTGDLLFFIDSDDYLKKSNVFEEIMKVYSIYNPDIILFDIEIIRPHSTEVNKPYKEPLDIKEYNNIELLSNTSISCNLYSKIFKKELLKEKMFYNSNVYEDFYLLFLYLDKCKNFFYLHQTLYCLYHGEDNNNHLSATYNIEKQVTILHIINETYSKVKNYAIKKSISNFCIPNVIETIKMKGNKKYKSDINNEIKKIINIIEENNLHYYPTGRLKLMKYIIYKLYILLNK